MENTNDNVFNIKYNEKLNKLEMGASKKKRGILKIVSQNKTLIGIIFAFIFFSWFNVLLIYKFYKIVELFA
jgi:hypothetical protein